MKILAVDDDEIALSLLGKASYDFHRTRRSEFAHNGREALQKPATAIAGW